MDITFSRGVLLYCDLANRKDNKGGLVMILTDKDGQRFKLVHLFGVKENSYLLEPIEPAAEKGKKKEWSLIFMDRVDKDKGENNTFLIDKFFHLTQPQATAIKEAVDALLEYVTADEYDPLAKLRIMITNKADKARQTIGGQDG